MKYLLFAYNYSVSDGEFPSGGALDFITADDDLEFVKAAADDPKIAWADFKEIAVLDGNNLRRILSRCDRPKRAGYKEPVRGWVDVTVDV